MVFADFPLTQVERLSEPAFGIAELRAREANQTERVPGSREVGIIRCQAPPLQRERALSLLLGRIVTAEAPQDRREIE